MTNCFVKKSQKTPRKEIKMSREIEIRIPKKQNTSEIKNVQDFEDLLKDKCGFKETESRDAYEAKSLAFSLGAM